MAWASEGGTRMLELYRMDLHVHTCLSPCADNGMVPPAIVAAAVRAGLQAIGVCDHNSAANAAAVQSAARGRDLAVLPGLEVTSREEVHLLTFFENAEELAAFAGLVSAHLSGTNEPSLFGEQIVVDERGEPLELEERLLAGATDLGAAELAEAAHRQRGLVIAAHIDREAFSVVSQLGFIPRELGLDAVELSVHAGAEGPYRRHGYPIVRSSDAHFPEEVGRASSLFRLAEPTVSELGKALRGVEERGLLG
jgi:PHP family Zn ribbon phosphoesterase